MFLRHQKEKKFSWKIKLKKSKNNNFIQFLQQLGKCFMLPIALIAFCGILLGIGSAFTSASIINQIPWLGKKGFQIIFGYMNTIGKIAFTYLPLLFCMAIALGLASDNKGVAGLSSFIGFMTIVLMINWMLTITGRLVNEQYVIGELGLDKWQTLTTIQQEQMLKTVMNRENQSVFFGIQTIDIGILGAILTGLLVLMLHQKFQYIKFPAAIGFFGGRRFVPIITILVFSIIALPITFIWPFIGKGFYWIGVGIEKTQIFGSFLYRFTERLVGPVCLHHIFNVLVRFTSVGGEYITNDGTKIEGALNIYYYLLNNNLWDQDVWKYTRFLSQGYMAPVMFGLPAAGLAMYITAQKDQKLMVKGLVISGSVASIIGGITEPLEFMFLFAQPLLYLFHAFMVGVSYLLLGLFHTQIGNTDGNIIDLIIFGIMQGLQTKWWIIFIIGPIYFLIYFSTFYFAIKKFNIKTPGREVKITTNENDNVVVDKNEQAEHYLQLLGGKDNIKVIDNCFTRLRISLKTPVNIIYDDVSKLGAIGLKIIDDYTLQIIIGPNVEHIANAIKQKIK